MRTASELFSKDKTSKGDHLCFYCGASCDDKNKKSDYVKNTFTNRDIVKYPGSDYVCSPCVASLETITTTKQIDGTEKSGRAGAPRMYSWILTGKDNYAFTKKHLEFLRVNILNPPDPPFSFVLADSGQKQLIFRAPVNYDKNIYSVMLEEKTIIVDLSVFPKILNSAIITCAAIGKKSLSDPDNFNCYKQTIELYNSELPLVEWLEYYNTPMGELAAWICAGKEECRNDNIVSRRLQEEVGGDNRPIAEVAGDGGESDQGRSDQILFDFT